jgi:hypothetical protein
MADGPRRAGALVRALVRGKVARAWFRFPAGDCCKKPEPVATAGDSGGSTHGGEPVGRHGPQEQNAF